MKRRWILREKKRGDKMKKCFSYCLPILKCSPCLYTSFSPSTNFTADAGFSNRPTTNGNFQLTELTNCLLQRCCCFLLPSFQPSSCPLVRKTFILRLTRPTCKDVNWTLNLNKVKFDNYRFKPDDSSHQDRESFLWSWEPELWLKYVFFFLH
jgi:hypothetical protein